MIYYHLPANRHLTLVEQHISVMIIMQFMIGLTTAGIFTVCSKVVSWPGDFDANLNAAQMTATLLTDLNRHRSATAQGACSLVRCLGAGAAIAAMQPLADRVGLGWCFAVYALLLLVEVPLVWLIMTRGLHWRTSRRADENDA